MCLTIENIVVLICRYPLIKAVPRQEFLCDIRKIFGVTLSTHYNIKYNVMYDIVMLQNKAAAHRLYYECSSSLMRPRPILSVCHDRGCQHWFILNCIVTFRNNGSTCPSNFIIVQRCCCSRSSLDSLPLIPRSPLDGPSAKAKFFFITTPDRRQRLQARTTPRPPLESPTAIVL